MTETQAPARPFMHPDGIYFGLDVDTYHRDPALGSTDVRALLVHPAVYWWQSWMNPLYVERQTDFKQWGSAFHVLICEGEAKFASRYYRGPAKRDFGKELLVTADNLKKWLSGKGLAVSGTKEVLQKRVLDTDQHAPVWDAIVERAAIFAGDRTVLDPDMFDAVSLSSKMITKNPECSKAFENGYPEVSVFWTDRWGVRLKARFDYLRFRAVVDLKSFRNWRQMSMHKAITNAIGNYRLDVQAAHYLNARAQVARLVAADKVFGEVAAPWLDRLVTAETSRLVWIFYQAEGAPIALRYEWDVATLAHDNAESEVGRALESYRRYREVFGEEIWVDVSERHVINTEDLPAYMGVG